MPKIQNPVLFSSYFRVDPDLFRASGIIDPFINVDTPLFIDPVLLEKSDHPAISDSAFKSFKDHFTKFIRLLAISKAEGDAAWKGARRLLDLQEPPENGLGYGGTRRSGSSRPEDVRLAIMRTAKEIIELGSHDPEMVSLMGFFEENVGPDTISDFTTRVIFDSLAAITESFCCENAIPVHYTVLSDASKLPLIPSRLGRKTPLILVPSDIVRELPIAKDWSDIEMAAFENAQIRHRVNALLAGIAQPTVAERKSALRTVALSSPDSFEHFLMVVKEHVTSYDPLVDALGYYKIKQILAHGFEGLRSEHGYDLSAGPEEIKKFVVETLHVFKHHVENGNLWEELWINGKPKKERAAQLIYFAIADAFCRANNLDISPEANMGGGPVDFKFSKGYRARVLVEMKRSSGAVRHGYEKQLEIYKDATQTQYGIFVIIDYGDLGDKLSYIYDVRRQRLARGESASDIVVIDARKKASASRRH